jgi:hypothetical protein
MKLPILIGDIIKKPTLLSNVACRRKTATGACQGIIYKKSSRGGGFLFKKEIPAFAGMTKWWWG